MGLLEDIDALTLSDDEKNKLKRSYGIEVDPLKNELGILKGGSRRDSTTKYIAELSDAGLKHAPRALAFVQRVLLSPDSEEPGVVLLSDTELNLSGDDATGARTSEDMSVKQVLETFFELLPRDKDGKLAMELSDQGDVTQDAGKPDNGDGTDQDAKSEEHRKSLSRRIGTEIGRPSRSKRYARSTAGVGGGEA